MTSTVQASLLDTQLWGWVDSVVDLDRGAMLALSRFVCAMHAED
jgi:hypothetical protein